MTMKDILEHYRKPIITGGGVLLFLFAGLITMLFTPSENDGINKPSSSPEIREQQNSRPPQNLAATSEPQVPPQKIIYAYVTGEVMRPGVYKLSEDSRIFELIDAAGGFSQKADTSSLNLAGFLADGVHVHVGAKFQEAQGNPTIPGLPASSRQASGLVDINRASAAELSGLPGIGASIAQRIVDYRQVHGAFTRPEDIMNVNGIGAAKFRAIQGRITVSGTSITSSTGGLIDINRASAAELSGLPGIGASIAQRIVDYRQVHGAFTRPEDIMNVNGIGAAKFRAIQGRITVSGTSITSSTDGLIDINRASAKELEQLTGVGPATAKRIVEYRQLHGNFTRPEDLINVRGIGAAKLEKMRGQIVIR